MEYWELLEEQHEHDVILRPSQIDAETEDDMNIIDAYGDQITALPDNAKCRYVNENPEYMDSCPTDEFDGDCCPGACEYYTED